MNRQRCPKGRLSAGLLLLAGLGVQAQVVGVGKFFALADQSRTAFTVLGAGARANGAGGAFIAVADDATAVSFNPAGLAQLLKPEVSVVGDRLSRTIDFVGFASQTAKNPSTYEDSSVWNRWTRPSFASVALPVKLESGSNLVFQLSWQRMFDLESAMAVDYKAKQTGATTAQEITQDVRQNGGIDVYAASMGWELSNRLLVGASVNVWRGNWTFDSTSRNLSVLPNPTTDLSQKNEFRGINANLGLMWRSDYVNVGLVYRTPFTADYTFSEHYVYPDVVTGDPVQLDKPRQTVQVSWPETFGWGFALHPISRLQLAADWSRTRWSKARFEAAGNELDGLNFFDFKVASNTPDTTDFHVGGEGVAWLGDALVVPMRLGWFREPQPLVDAQTLQQRVFRGWTGGFGLKFRKLAVDLAYRDSKAQREVSRYNTDGLSAGLSSTAKGHESLEERRVMASLIYQMDEESTRKVLSWFFVGN